MEDSENNDVMTDYIPSESDDRGRTNLTVIKRKSKSL